MAGLAPLIVLLAGSPGHARCRPVHAGPPSAPAAADLSNSQLPHSRGPVVAIERQSLHWARSVPSSGVHTLRNQTGTKIWCARGGQPPPDSYSLTIPDRESRGKRGEVVGRIQPLGVHSPSDGTGRAARSGTRCASLLTRLPRRHTPKLAQALWQTLNCLHSASCCELVGTLCGGSGDQTCTPVMTGSLGWPLLVGL